ncbi:MAG TPA: hypothetical protein VH134_08195 [Candidatus Dormibacteraeota bacterium]|nr:hypothetical protein [Candidatus Dormibacteraeota bacterium]
MADIRTRAGELAGGLRVRMGRSSWGERALIGGSAAVLFALLFLPWLSASCTGGCNGFDFSSSIDGVHGFGWITLLGLLAVVGLWAVRCYPDRVRIPALPLRDSEIYLIAGAVEALGVVLFFFEYHGGVATFLYVSVTPAVGWFLALAGAVATAVGGWLLRAESARR